jgi:hypothetical protein
MTWRRCITHHSFTMLPIGRNLGDITQKSANLVVVVGEFSKTDVKSCELLERLVPITKLLLVMKISSLF